MAADTITVSPVWHGMVSPRIVYTDVGIAAAHRRLADAMDSRNWIGQRFECVSDPTSMGMRVMASGYEVPDEYRDALRGVV